MASVAALVTTRASDDPNAAVSCHEGTATAPSAASFAGRDAGVDARAAGGVGTAINWGVGSGRGANMSRNRRGGAATAAAGTTAPTSRAPSSVDTSDRRFHDWFGAIPGDRANSSVPAEPSGLRGEFFTELSSC